MSIIWTCDGELTITALPNRFDTTDPSAAWTEANRILIVGGSLADASLFLESFIRRATSSDLQQPGSSEIEAWSLLGRTHAMNEKEEKALSAFEEGRKLIEGVDPHSPGIGEMLTVSQSSLNLQKVQSVSSDDGN